MAQQQAFNAACVGRELFVLFERPGRWPGQLVGRSPYLQPVHAVLDPGAVGTLQRVRITAGGQNSLAGEALAGAAAS